MSNKYPGGLVTLNPPAQDPALGAATNGVWTMDQALNAETSRSWPMYDPYYNNVVLNLHGDAAVGGSFVFDASANNFAATIGGNPVANAKNNISGTRSFANGSGYFNGSADYASFTNNTAYAFGTGDFTVEAWVYLTSAPSSQMVVGSTYQNSSSGFTFSLESNVIKIRMLGDPVVLSGATSITANAWHHVAVSRSGTSLKVFLDGVQDGSATNSDNVALNSTAFNVGRLPNSSGYLAGYVSNLRVVKGAAVYTGNFATPSLLPLTSDGATSAACYSSTTNVNTSFASSATSLLTLQTPNPATNNGFIDSSSNNFTITRNGNTTQGAFNPYRQNGYWSNYFDGSSNIVGSLSSALGTGDFTVEFWVYIVSNTGISGEGGFFQTTTSSTGLSTSEYGSTSLTMQRNGTTNKYGFSLGATSVEFSNAGTYLNQWMHVACVRSSGTARIYLNGVLNSTPTSATTNLTGTYIGIGGYYNTNYLINAYISNFRVTNTVVYSANFTPPTAPLTAITGTLFLGCQSNRFLNTNSGAAMTVNTGTPSAQAFNPLLQNLPYESSRLGGSGYFDGTTDFLTVSKNTALEPATSGAWCLETWVYATSNTAGNLRIIAYANASVASGPDLGYYMNLYPGTSINAGFYSGGSDYNIASTSAVTAINTWTHIALTSDGTTMRLFVNGVSVGTPLTVTGVSINAPSAALFKVGNYSSSQYLYGYTSDTRFVKGSAVYTTTFTPPTTPLTAITNTSLLLNYTNGAIFDNAAVNNMETVGNAQISTSVKKYGTGSMYFDGTGDYLSTPVTTLLSVSGSFTVEAWVYTTSTADQTVFYLLGATNSYAGLRVGVTNSGAYVLHSQNGTGWAVNTGVVGTVPTNQWNHIAVTRNGNAGTLWVNGASAATFTFGDLYVGSVNLIGAMNQSGITVYMVGYIDDVRITKGVARYTAAFTPPTSQVQDQ